MCCQSCQTDTLTCGVFFQSKQRFRAEAAASEVQQGASLQRGDGDPLGCPKNHQKCAPQVQQLQPWLAVSPVQQCQRVLPWGRRVPRGGRVQFVTWRAPALRHLKQLVQHKKCSTQSKWASWYSCFYLKPDRSLKVLSVLVCVCSWVLEKNISMKELLV